MFTGIIEKKGMLLRAKKAGRILEMTIGIKPWPDVIRIGESIAVEGVCLTVIRRKRDSFMIEAVPETLRATTLGNLKVGDRVNLERSLRAGSRLGGHFVFGHVDGVGRIVKKVKLGKNYSFAIQVPPAVRPYLVPKGSVAVDGISLTIQKVLADGFEMAIIPHTAEETTIGGKGVGSPVNLEADMMMKYINEYLNRCRIWSKIKRR